MSGVESYFILRSLTHHFLVRHHCRLGKLAALTVVITRPQVAGCLQ